MIYSKCVTFCRETVEILSISSSLSESLLFVFIFVTWISINFDWESFFFLSKFVFFFHLQSFMEAQPSHPFFVYGKGWSSFNPDETLNDYGLKCQTLEIGDVCISLKPREQQQHQSPKISSESLSLMTSPENLSRKQTPHTILTTATGTAVTSRPTQSFEQSYMSHRHMSDSMYGHHIRSSNLDNSLRNYSTTMAPPPPPSSSSDSSSSTSNSYDDEAIDATMHSRKRRAWSISENHPFDDQKKCKSN